MPHVELYIADKLCDLQGDETIDVDYTIFDITKIESRGGARSYSFNLPKTDRNKKVLENPEMVNTLSSVPYTRLKCRCYIDGVDSLIRFCEVASVKDSYAIRLYGSNSDLFASIKDKKLSELDMSEFDHYWTLPVIAAGVARTVNEGYVYPLIDYHLDSPNSFINNDNKTVRADFMLPALYYNYVLRKIFEQTDYSFINTIADETIRVILPSTKQLKTNSHIGNRYDGKFGINNNAGLSGLYPPYFYQFDNVISQGLNYYILPKTIDAYPYGVQNCLFFQEAITAHIKFDFQINNLLVTPINIQTVLLMYDSNGASQVMPPNQTSGQFVVLSGINNYSFEYDIETQAGSSFIMFIVCNYYLDTSHIFILNSSTIEITNTALIEPIDLIYEDFITVASCLPDITQLELLKNYMQMFCLLPVIDEANKIVTLVKFDNILNNISNCYDWSNKLDLTEEAEISFIQDNYSQNNNFIYKQDGDEAKPIGTDGVIVINNQNLEKEKDIIELIFAGTNSVERCEGIKMNNIGVFENGEYKAEREPRVFVNVIQTLAGGGHILLQDENASTAVYTLSIPYFIDDSNTFNLGFGNNLLANYYDLISDVLSNVKLVKVLVRLNASDISQLDFTRPVFIQKYEAYFYISSIKGFTYTESKSTLVELVKINING